MYFQNKDEREHRITETHLSFLSGHASFAVQSATFFVLYLHAAFMWQRPSGSSCLFVPFLQALGVAAAFYTCISRVVDYKHHPSDVVAGALLGLIVQGLNVAGVTRLYSMSKYQRLDEEGDDTAIPLNDRHHHGTITNNTCPNPTTYGTVETPA